jgi:hypothetical protein
MTPEEIAARGDGKWCPRDEFGFCWIALWHPDDCGGLSDENGGSVRCPETEEEMRGRGEAARQHRIAEIAIVVQEGARDE